MTLFCSVVVYEICFVDKFDGPDTTINDSSAGKVANKKKTHKIENSVKIARGIENRLIGRTH